jgi:hypothetical protein
VVNKSRELLEIILDRYYPSDEHGVRRIPEPVCRRVVLDELRKFQDGRPAGVRWPGV